MNTYADFAKANGFDLAAVQSLSDFIIERMGEYITEDNVVDIVEAYVPEWLRVQEKLALIAHMNPAQFAEGIRLMIEAEALMYVAVERAA